jgi:thiamine biosynthesis lipoprotein
MADTDPPATAPDLPDLHTLVVGREAMACRFEVVFNAGEVADATELGLAALDLVDAIEDRITVYRDSSDVARLNAVAAEGWQPVAADIVALLAQAQRLHEQTGGAFDPAAGSLVRAWGFLRRQGRTPDAALLAAARARSGLSHVEIDESGARIRFTRPGIEFNLGAIGKGWALDAVIGMLTAAGVASVLVHGGSSSVRAMGVAGPTLPGRRGWRVGVRHPLRPGRRLATVTLVDAALGTSGSGTQFFVDRGRRLGHILDPRTGVPAEGVLSSTVITPQAADADALSTALYVLGPAGLERIAPAGGDTAAILVVPARNPASVRVLTANLDPELVAWDSGEGIEVVRVV